MEEKAVGTVLSYDVTETVPRWFKGVAFSKKHIVLRKGNQREKYALKHHATHLS